MSAMRLEEQRHIFDELKHQLLRLYADQNDQRTVSLADKILKDVRDRNLGELTNTWEENCHAHPELRKFNPYKLIRRFEDAIKPPAAKPPVASGRHAVETCQQPAGSKSFPIDLGELRQVVGQGINTLVKRKSLADNSQAIIDGILSALEARVKIRQRERAMSLIEQRQATVAEWRRELQQPGSTRRPSPKGQGHQRVGSSLSASRFRSLPQRSTNGYPPPDNGEGSSRTWEEEQFNQEPQLPSSNYGQWRETEDRPIKGKERERPHAAELSSVSTRLKRAGKTVGSSTPQDQRAGMVQSVPQQAGSSSQQNGHNGVNTVHGLTNGLQKLQVNFDDSEESWRHGDDLRLGGSRG